MAAPAAVGARAGLSGRKSAKITYALFETAAEVGDGQAIRLTVQIKHIFPDGMFVLGRFRLSFTNDANAMQATRIRLDLKDSELTDVYASLGTAYAQLGQSIDAVAAFNRALALIKDNSDNRQTDLQNNAVRIAVLAAAGQGKDDPPLDDAAKTKLRGQALDWLKAELTVLSKLFDTGPPQERPAILAKLSVAWQAGRRPGECPRPGSPGQIPGGRTKGMAVVLGAGSRPADGGPNLAGEGAEVALHHPAA